MDYEITEQDTSCLPEPLTKRKKADGKIYRRQAVVDRQIREALKLDHKELRRRSEIRDEESPDYLKEESLVYLIRHYHKVGNQRVVNDLSKSLLYHRSAKYIYKRLGSLRGDLRDEGYSNVVAELFSRIIDLRSDRGDFLQIRFGLCLKRLTVQVFRKQLNQLKLERNSIPLTSLEGYDVEETNPLVRPRSIELEVIEKDLIRAALSQLKEPLRSAYLLRYYENWPIEDQDPNVQTISRHFNKTPRTIRNWFTEAEKCLEAWREENRDE